MKIKLNKDLGGFKQGNTLTLNTNKNGVPLNQYWRRRLEEAKIDSAIEILDNNKTSSNKKKRSKTLNKGDNNDNN